MSSRPLELLTLPLPCPYTSTLTLEMYSLYAARSWGDRLWGQKRWGLEHFPDYCWLC